MSIADPPFRTAHNFRLSVLSPPWFRTSPGIRAAGGRARQKPARRTPDFPSSLTGRNHRPAHRIAQNHCNPMSWCLIYSQHLGLDFWTELPTSVGDTDPELVADHRDSYRPFSGVHTVVEMALLQNARTTTPSAALNEKGNTANEPRCPTLARQPAYAWTTQPPTVLDGTRPSNHPFVVGLLPRGLAKAPCRLLVDSRLDDPALMQSCRG